MAGLGITGAAAAQDGPSDPAGPADVQLDRSSTGSVPTPQADEGGVSESKNDEAAEAKALEGLATVTPDQARAAALEHP